MTRTTLFKTLPFLAATVLFAFHQPPKKWESKFVKVNADGSLQYTPDEKGNILPDFSRVGYYRGDKAVPVIPVVKTIGPGNGDNQQELIQAAIDEISAKPLDANGFRGTLLLQKGTYNIPGTLKINAAGVILRGEGNETKIVATGRGQRTLISVSGEGNIKETAGTRTEITDAYVPTGTTSFHVKSSAGYKAGDNIILFRPGTDQWIKDLKMDQIDDRGGTKQWQPKEYDLSFERIITKVEGNTITIDNPVVLAMEPKYGGGAIFKYTFNGRINHVGIEQLYCESAYANDTAEDHGWNAIQFNKIENGWVTNVTSRYFGYSCVNLGNQAKWITVDHCTSLDAKSQITGSRRYSFNNDGQQNLVMNCHTTEGRHDYVTGAKVCGPNVFYNCTAEKTHADIGPHHRWAMGTLYDNIVTDGEINIQDRGNWGSGHGWSGVTQILWNCTAQKVAVQNPWASGKNYCIGLKGSQVEGRLKGRPNGEWEGQNKEGLQPASLYMAQVKAKKM
ncbi:MAG: hypothetical protein QM731_24860 [Chitinophagaceae bacterium]